MSKWPDLVWYRRGCPEAAGTIGDPQVRNRGTIGGNIAHADPASDWPTVLTALNATIHIRGMAGERSVSACDFFVDLFETSLQEDELITGISVLSHDNGTGSAYAKMFHPAFGICHCGRSSGCNRIRRTLRFRQRRSWRVDRISKKSSVGGGIPDRQVLERGKYCSSG